MVRRLHADPRFRRLPTRTRFCLTVAVGEIADGDGRWWWKVKTWADRAAVSPSTITRTIRDAKRVGLITVEPYLRPDGRQGSSTYVLDPRLVAKLPDLPSDAPCADPPPVTHSASTTTSPSRTTGPNSGSGTSLVTQPVSASDLTEHVPQPPLTSSVTRDAPRREHASPGALTYEADLGEADSPKLMLGASAPDAPPVRLSEADIRDEYELLAKSEADPSFDLGEALRKLRMARKRAEQQRATRAAAADLPAHERAIVEDLVDHLDAVEIVPAVESPKAAEQDAARNAVQAGGSHEELLASTERLLAIVREGRESGAPHHTLFADEPQHRRRGAYREDA